MEVESTTEHHVTTTSQTTTTQSGSTPSGLVASSALVIVFVASVVEFIAAARICHKGGYCQKEFAFAVAVGVASAFFTFAVLLYLRFVPTLNHVVIQILAFMLTGLWIAGAGITTFRNPFVATGNGYFSAWLAFGASAYFLHANVAFVQGAVNKVYSHGATASTDTQALWVMFFASVIELVSAGVLCDASVNCTDEIAWAVAVGAISVFMCIIALALGDKLGPIKLVLALLLLGLWIFGAGVLTFDSPFIFTGNGYFSCWVAFFASVVWAYIVLGEKIPALKRTTFN